MCSLGRGQGGGVEGEGRVEWLRRRFGGPGGRGNIPVASEGKTKLFIFFEKIFSIFGKFWVFRKNDFWTKSRKFWDFEKISIPKNFGFTCWPFMLYCREHRPDDCEGRCVGK